MATTLPVFVSSATNAQEAIARKLHQLFPGGCKRILLVNPLTVMEGDFDVAVARRCSYSASLPYGPALLSRQLQNAGYSTDLIDLNYEVLRRAHDDEDFSYGVWRDLLGARINAFRPDLIGVSNMFSTGYHCVQAAIAHSKAVAPDVPVIAGGVHATGYPKFYLEDNPGLDLLMTHESDSSFPKLLDVANGKRSSGDVFQVATFVDGEYLEVTESDIPEPAVFDVMPDYHGLPIGDYWRVGMIGGYRWYPKPGGVRAATLHTRRGCRAHCTFCSVENFNGPGVRRRDDARAVDELQWLIERHGINHFMFIDDDPFDRFIVNFLNEIVRRRLPVTWEASNGVIASATTPEILSAASESGCIGLHFGVESGSEKILKSVMKPSGVRHFRRLRSYLEPYPQIFSRGMLMLGFPGETISQINETVNLGLEMGLDWYPIQIVNFLGNTAMTRKLLKEGVLQEGDIIDAAFFVGAFGKQQKRERDEAQAAKPFPVDILQRDGSYTPTKEELPDIWFMMDWLLNWKPLLAETNMTKLRLKLPFLEDICRRKTLRNPLATMFLGIVEAKLGLAGRAQSHFSEARVYLNESAFWRIRCDALGLPALLDPIAATREDG